MIKEQRVIRLLFSGILFFCFAHAGSQNLKLTKISGDNQQQTSGTRLNDPIVLRLTDQTGKPLQGIVVKFIPLTSPSPDDPVQPSVIKAITDTMGMVTTHIRLGGKSGEYTLMAEARQEGELEYTIYRFTSLKKNWIFFLVTGLLGGLGLFLLGMNMMSKGLQKSAGKGLRTLLGSITRNRFLALLAGAVVTMVIQSSSATSVMLISFVNSGLMSFSQSLGVLLGAGLGTTITAQLIAFKITDYALLIIALGFIMNNLLKNEKVRQSGEAILGFGILFFGMNIMSESMIPLRTFTPFLDIITKLENPFTGILAGAVLTALIQSSSAFIGIMIVLAGQGLLSLEASVPLVFGANIGTAITAVLASLNARREAKRVALAHTIFKLIGVSIFIWFIPELIELIKLLSPSSGNPDAMGNLALQLPRQVANIHTIFNVLLVMILLPFLNTMARLITKILPDKPGPEDDLLKTKYLHKAYDLPPSLALKIVNQEVTHMAHIVQDMVNNLLPGFLLKEKSIPQWMNEKEKQVDYLRDELNEFLKKIMAGKMEENRSTEAFELMYTIREFEQIADIVHSLYKDKGQEWLEQDAEFSEEGKNDLSEYHLQVIKQISRAIEVFRKHNLSRARTMKSKHNKYRAFMIQLEKKHYLRIAGGNEQTLKSSQMHQELMTALVTIYSHATNVARIFLEWEHK